MHRARMSSGHVETVLGCWKMGLPTCGSDLFLVVLPKDGELSFWFGGLVCETGKAMFTFTALGEGECSLVTSVPLE